jgi:hypothetical protein
MNQKTQNLNALYRKGIGYREHCQNLPEKYQKFHRSGDPKWYVRRKMHPRRNGEASSLMKTQKHHLNNVRGTYLEFWEAGGDYRIGGMLRG